MNLDDRFASRLESVDALPEPFRTALKSHLSKKEEARLIIYGPPFESGQHSPATVFAAADEHWFVAMEEGEGRASVDECDFRDTLLVELTEILLYGQLKLDFLKHGAPRAITIEFNTVMEKLYREAIGLVLDGMESETSNCGSMKEDVASLESLPLKFRNAITHYLPEPQRLRAAVHWPAVRSGFGRELTPAGGLLLTDREVVLISDEKSLSLVRAAEQKLGTIITWFPLIRLARFEVSQHGRVSIVRLEVHAGHGGESLEILFAPECADAVTRLLKQSVVPMG